MNSNVRERLKEFLVVWLEKLSRVGYQLRNADEIQQAFLDDLSKRLGELDDRIG
ncbi:hypothetical protein QUB33_28645 [Microcoleus sp. B3-A4]|uniref:hypothetical protein n=1 Tax=Microcoleus sp. B3-A4 TaxID=2818653 RepID=UPI002FD134CB